MKKTTFASSHLRGVPSASAKATADRSEHLAGGTSPGTGRYLASLKMTLYKLCYSSVLAIVVLLLTISSPVLAADEGIGCGEGFGLIAEFLCTEEGSKEEAVAQKLNDVVSSMIGFLTIIAALWFGFQIIMAGFAWISAGGDKTKTEEAQKKITNSLIGIIVVVSAWILLGIIGKIMGLEILNPGEALLNLTK